MSTLSTTEPSYREVASLVSTQGFYAAQDAIKGMALFTSDEQTFTFGPNTDLRGSITLRPGGTLDQVEEHLADIRIHSSPSWSAKYGYFIRIWAEVQAAASQAIRETLAQTFPQVQDSTLEHLINPESTRRRKASRVLDLITTTAVSARSTTGHGYLSRPNMVGAAALIRFLGKEPVSLTLSLAGPRATLYDFSVVTANRKLFTQANSLNPNAFHIWYHSNRTSLYQGTALRPEQIVAQAEQLLAQAGAPPDGTSHQQLWATAGQLNQRAVKHYTQSAKDLVSLASLAAKARSNPSYTATKALTNPYIGAAKLPTPLVNAFISASETTLRTRRKTQRQLLNEFHGIAKLIQHRPQANAWEINQALNHLNQMPENTLIGWEQVTRMFPMQAADDLSDIIRKPAAKNGHKPNADRKAPPHRRAHWHDLKHLIEGPAKAHILQALRESLTVQSLPGRKLQVRLADRPTPILTAWKTPDGQIFQQHDGYHPHNELPDPLNPRPTAAGWSTRGLMESTAAKDIAKHIADNWDQLSPNSDKAPPTQNAVIMLVHHWSQTMAQQDPSNYRTEEQLSNALVETLTSLIDTDTFRLAEAIFGTADHNAYNLTVRARPLIDQLISTNPGAVTWALNNCTGTEKTSHPGQVIATAKQSLSKAGLLPSSWKTAAKLPAPVMLAITTAANTDTNAAYALNLIATAQALPSPGIAAHLASMQSMHRQVPTQTDPQAPKTAHQQIVQRFSTLLCRESRTRLEIQPHDTRQDTLLEETRQIVDYVSHISGLGDELSHTTWKGLAKASATWHRRLTETPIHLQWQDILQSQDGQYWEWDSVLDTATARGVTIRPLRSQYDLYLESLQMNHCVIGYGPLCASGTSRIFSVTLNDSHIATSQIAVQNGKWTAVQTRGYRNHPVPDDITAVMQEVADRYQRALSSLEYTGQPPKLVAAEPSQVPQHLIDPEGPHQHPQPGQQQRPTMRINFNGYNAHINELPF